MSDGDHGDRAIYCEAADRYLLGRTPDGDCPFCGTDLTGERYERLQDRVEEKQDDDELVTDGGTAEHEAGVKQYDTINEFTVAGEFGFQRIPGPFEVDKSGNVWAIAVPKDAHPTVSTLTTQKGEAAVLVADGKAVGGGVISEVAELEEHDEVHLLVDQYAMGESHAQ